MTAHTPINTTTARPSTLALSLAVLGIPAAPVETDEAEALYIRAAGEKVRLARAIETGGIAKARATKLAAMLENAVEDDHQCFGKPVGRSPVINGPNWQLSGTHRFLRDYGAAIDAVCTTACRIENENREAAGWTFLN